MKDFARTVFGKELMKLAEKNDFVVFNADTKSCAIEDFGEFYPDRNFSFGIAEQNLVAAAAGAASCGEKVYLATFAVFASMRACEQVRTFVCYPNLNVTLLASHAGLQTGADGATHAAIEDVAIMRSFPNMTVVEPSDYIAAKKLAALSLDFKGPLYIRFPKTALESINDESSYEMTIGKANWVCHHGDDIALVASGWMLSVALEAAEMLKHEGILATVLEMHTVKPLDSQSILRAAEQTGAVISIEDHSIIGGLGSAIAEVLGEQYPVPMKRIGVRDRFPQSGDPAKLYEENEMTAVDIVRAAKELIERKKAKK